MIRPPYEPTCPEQCHLDEYRNLPNMQHSPDDAILMAEERAASTMTTHRVPYLFRRDVSL